MLDSIFSATLECTIHTIYFMNRLSFEGYLWLHIQKINCLISEGYFLLN